MRVILDPNPGAVTALDMAEFKDSPCSQALQPAGTRLGFGDAALLSQF